MIKKKIPHKTEEINIDDATIEMQEVPYFMMPNAAIDDEGNLTAYELLVYCVLCRYGNRGKAAFPSYETILRKAAVSRATVARALTGLLEKGFIVKQNRAGSSNVYRVLFEPVSHRDGVVSHRDGLPVSQRDTRKINPSINKEEKGPLSNSALKAIEHFKKLNPGQVVRKKDTETLNALIKYYDLDTILKALTIHVTEPDNWTKERGSSLSTFSHNLPGYLDKIKQKQAEADREEKQKEYQLQLNEEERQEEAKKRQEEERRAALTSEQRRLEDIASRRLRVNMILELRQNSTDQGHETAEKIKSCLAELAELAAEEARLLPQIKEA